MSSEISLVEDEEIRNRFKDNVAVLEKVNELITIAQSDMMTVRQVAKYFEAKEKTIHAVINRNQKELEQSGCTFYTNKEVTNLLNLQAVDLKTNVEINQLRGKAEAIIGDYKLVIPNRGLLLVSKRAVLNIGMLLTESDVALKVRQYLLDAEDSLNKEQKQTLIDEITKEQKLQLGVINAKGDTERMLALSRLTEYQNEKTNKYKVKVENLTHSDATFGIRESKTNLGVGERQFVRYLLDNKYCYRQHTSNSLKPFASYTDGSKLRLFTQIKGIIQQRNKSYTTTVLTIEGLEYFREKVDAIKQY